MADFSELVRKHLKDIEAQRAHDKEVLESIRAYLTVPSVQKEGVSCELHDDKLVVHYSGNEVLTVNVENGQIGVSSRGKADQFDSRDRGKKSAVQRIAELVAEAIQADRDARARGRAAD